MSLATKQRLSSAKTKRTFTKQELRRHLEILGPVTNPLPATLPPSPPASRSASPIPQPSSSKRKRGLESDSNPHSSSTDGASSTASKRSRTSPDDATPAPPALHNATSVLNPTAPNPAPKDDPPAQAAFPIRRPRRGRNSRNPSAILQKYMEQGRMFKRSAEARLNAYLRPEQSMFAMLKNRPSMDSPYAKYDRMMSRFEALDSLLTFAYAQFYYDLAQNTNNLTWWLNSEPYFRTLLERHMEGFTNPGPAEEALHGIHFMVDAYWRARQAWHHLRYSVEHKVGHILAEHHKSPSANKASPAVSETSARSSSVNLNTMTLQPTPPSTGHSPAGAQVNGVNGVNGHTPTSRSPAGPPGVVFPEELAKMVLTSTRLFTASSNAFVQASQRITLPILEQHFPQTYARLTKSTLKYNDEFEIDFEDDESELFWPLAPSRGEGLGWVLALGRSMLREYARGFGYRGVEGVVRQEDISYPNKR